jgi:hypothetical protein
MLDAERTLTDLAKQLDADLLIRELLKITRTGVARRRRIAATD